MAGQEHDLPLGDSCVNLYKRKHRKHYFQSAKPWKPPTLPPFLTVPSAQAVLTSLFGMVRGVSQLLLPPWLNVNLNNLCQKATHFTVQESFYSQPILKVISPFTDIRNLPIKAKSTGIINISIIFFLCL